MGGIDGLVAGLNTDAARGLDIESGHQASAETSSVKKYTPDPSAPPPSPPGTEDRTRVYGTNVLPSRPSKTLLQLMWLALKDKVLVLLSIAAVIAFALGLFQDFGQPRPEGEPPVDWVEGVAIMIAVLIVVLVGSVNDWQKERQFRALGEKRDERGVTVLRRGVERVVDVRAVLVGDVALLEPGEVVPCDGVLLAGHNVRCDESGATGESDAIKKVAYADMLRLTADKDADEPAHTDCFLISGSKVLEGYGRYVVIAVGPRSFNGRIMMGEAAVHVACARRC
jgi:Ca2+-transporting ATPase